MLRTLLLTTLLFSASVHAAEESRKLAPFNAVNSRGPFVIKVEAGKAQSVVIRGREDYITQVETQVVNGELLLYYKDKDRQKSKTLDGMDIVITVPALSKYQQEGAGETILRNLAGERVDISYRGAGRLEASGKVKLLRLKAQGVGEVNTKALLAENADVNFEGMGDVSIYASGTLNAVVRGMGNMSYYGHPKTLNKSVQGMGSVKAGD
ncbi:GIN domain-containing protein [Pseudoduganella violacea]|uniref:Putative auto-transporter adhesin head GIN domain-containing protein n=1 Tax=Pseudoduganella violacea TaxID=1715466 RepID=A0A7W5FTS9_9BURK|nr:DUF2807 domain-containing protein [Pseudoduganella violacea]MBB3118508.1 hypothetical protein [Pseudoduganella violacea]